MTLRAFVEISGWVAALLILGSYGMLSIGRMQARSALYQWMNVRRSGFHHQLQLERRMAVGRAQRGVDGNRLLCAPAQQRTEGG